MDRQPNNAWERASLTYDLRVLITRRSWGSDLGRFAVVGIGGPVIDPADNAQEFQNRLALSGVAPDAGEHSGRFAVLLGPAADGRIVPGVVAGVTVVKLKVTDSADRFADVADGQTGHLAGSPSGSAAVLWREDAESFEEPVRAVVRLGGAAAEAFWARITGSTPAGDNRWTYSWEEVRKTSAGYGGWEAPEGGRTGEDDAYNALEDMNGDTGVQGNGVDLANLDTDDYTFALQPCPAGAVVRMRPARFTGDGDPVTEYWFEYANGIDGGCDTGEE